MERGLASVWRDALGEDRWRSAYKFCFVRNPYDRAVSSWKHACKLLARGVPIAKGHLTRSDPRMTANRLSYKLRGRAVFDCSVSFREFLALLSTGRLITHALWHSTPQAVHVMDMDGQVVVDFVGRFENLDSDFRELCRALGMPDDGLPKLNPSARSEWQSYYEEKTRELVAELYRTDFLTFGYPV